MKLKTENGYVDVFCNCSNSVTMAVQSNTEWAEGKVDREFALTTMSKEGAVALSLAVLCEITSSTGNGLEQALRRIANKND